MTSWKTTVTGLITMLAGVGVLWAAGSAVDPAVKHALYIVGLGLLGGSGLTGLVARDNGVTSEESGASKSAAVRRAAKSNLPVLVLLILPLFMLAACSQTPATVSPTATNRQQAGQGDTSVATAAGDAQAAVGDRANRHGAVDLDAADPGATITTPVLDEQGNPVVDPAGNVLMHTITARGIRTLVIGGHVEYSPTATSTASGTTTGTTQGQESPTTASQTQTPTQTVSPTTDVSVPLTP